MTIHHWRSNDLAEDYKDILQHVLSVGEEVAPRGKLTREVLSFTLELTDPTRALVRDTNRKIVPALAAAEALQLVGGFSDPRAMMQVSEHFEQFMDGGVFHAPYGPRIATQVPEALIWLMRDPDTRKAHVSVWQPQQDLWTRETRDHPCTTHLQFMIRKNALDLHVGMRANDAWRGFPYDVFQFTQLQQAAAACLHMEPGTYYHHATSFHLYEENYDMVDGLQSSSQPPLLGVSVDNKTSGWSFAAQRARELFYGSPPGTSTPFTFPHNDGEEFMYHALRKRGVTGSW